MEANVDAGGGMQTAMWGAAAIAVVGGFAVAYFHPDREEADQIAVEPSS